MAKNTYRGILFDKDGTLIDLAGPWLHDILGVIHRLDSARVEELAGIVGLDTKHMQVIPFMPLAQSSFMEVASLLSLHVPNYTAQDIFGFLVEVANTGNRDIMPLSGTVETIKQLHAMGYILGIISNDRENGIRLAMTELAITPYIHYIAGTDSGYGAKPNAGMVEGFCAEFDLAAETVVMVGDSPPDMQTAQMGKCGLSVGINSDVDSPILKHYTAHVLPNLKPLPALLAQLNTD